MAVLLLLRVRLVSQELNQLSEPLLLQHLVLLLPRHLVCLVLLLRVHLVLLLLRVRLVPLLLPRRGLA